MKMYLFPDFIGPLNEDSYFSVDSMGIFQAAMLPLGQWEPHVRVVTVGQGDEL